VSQSCDSEFCLFDWSFIIVGEEFNDDLLTKAKTNVFYQSFTDPLLNSKKNKGQKGQKQKGQKNVEEWFGSCNME
jgi:hypothetical protein